MISFSFHKNILINLIIYIILILEKVFSDDCLTNSFSGLTYPKAKTLSNGYHLMISAEGIFSLTPTLSKIVFSYYFTEEQKFSTDVRYMKNTINQVEISQFSGEEGEEKYILCLSNNYIYFLTPYGKVLFNKELTYKIDIDYKINLIAYKYFSNNYYFIIAYTNLVTNKTMFFYYYKIVGQNNIEFIYKEESTLSNGDDLNLNTFSCQAMNSEYDGKVLTCFLNFKSNDNYYFIKSFSFLPDNRFSFLSMSTYLQETESNQIRYIKSVTNNDKKKAFGCYQTQSPDQTKFFYFDITLNTLNSISFVETQCSFQYFGVNIYFFEKSNEYIFSCLNNDQKDFFFKKFDNNFNLIDDISFYGKTFENCYTLYFFSIIYISKHQQYSTIIQSNCNGGTHIRIYMLSEAVCIMPSESDDIEGEVFTSLPAEKDLTTIPQIETTIPKIISTLPNLETTVIYTTTITQETTIPEIKTTFPKIETTFTEIETTVWESIMTMTKESDTEYPSEELCKDNNKIYYNGNCICDINKGYYSINSKLTLNKCYKKNEIPINTYFNDTIKAYEFCYKTCKTCLKGGNFYENNCIDCDINYIKEPKKDSTNCVNNCKYLYFYNSLNQYSCTEDEQCPEESSLIVRIKDKCVNKCSNDETNKYQYNGECLSSCPINTEAKRYNICQIIDINKCSTSDYILDLDETIKQENVKLAAKNYANEFYYTINHITRFLSKNFTMVLYKNSSCIKQLNLDTTKIEYDSCITQIKIDNNIQTNEDIIIAVIDILSEDKPITSFGFFNSKTGEKLDASKSCSDKSVIMYENILNILNDPLALKLLEEQNINIFDLEDNFYRDICFHFDSPNGKDATLQDRIKKFFPNITLCNQGCKNKGINMTTMEAQCECTFQDLLSNNLFNNDIIGDNVLIKEALNEIMEMASNLNLEILACYKDVFNFKYFKKNIGGFIILSFIFIQIACFIYYYLIAYKKLIKNLYSLTEQYIKSKRNKSSIIYNPPKNKQEENQKEINEYIYGIKTKINKDRKNKINFSEIKRDNTKLKNNKKKTQKIIYNKDKENDTQQNLKKK